MVHLLASFPVIALVIALMTRACCLATHMAKSKLCEGKIALAHICRESPGHQSNDQGDKAVEETQNSPPRAGCELIDKLTASPWWADRFVVTERVSVPSESPFSGLSGGRMQVVRAYDHLKAGAVEHTFV